MKKRHQGSVRAAIEDLVRLTADCRDTRERLAVLEPYLKSTRLLKLKLFLHRKEAQ